MVLYRYKKCYKTQPWYKEESVFQAISEIDEKKPSFFGYCRDYRDVVTDKITERVFTNLVEVIPELEASVFIRELKLKELGIT